MRSLLFAFLTASALQGNALRAQYAISATAEVVTAHVTTPARVEVSAGTGVIRIQAVEGAAPARGTLERTYVTAATPGSPRAVWLADERGLRQQQCETAAIELRMLLRQRALELPRDAARRIIVTKVVAANS